MIGRSRELAFAMALSMSTTSSLAQAQAEHAIDEGVRLYGEADFEAALAALERAEHERLDRRALLRLLATRALVRFALGDFERLERDLLAIVSIQPDYDLGVRAPPPIANALARARAGDVEPLSVHASAEPTAHGVRVVATTRGDRADIVERVVLYARPAGRSAFSRGEGAVELAVPTRSEIEVHAQAIGPGGAVLAMDGSEEAPRRVRAPEPAVAEEPDERGSPWPWVALGLGVAAAAALAIVLVVVLGGSDDTRPTGPILVP